MPPGAFTGDLDLIQLLLAAFGLFFAGLVIFLRREDKREGYPLAPTTPGRRYPVIGWPAPPPTKVFRLMHGGTAEMPHWPPQDPIEGTPPPAMGRPLPLVLPPLLSGLGAGASVVRSDQPMMSIDGDLVLKPLRNAPDWKVVRGEADPRGMAVIGRDFRPAGRVADLWVDRPGRLLRYIEVELGDGSGIVLAPIFLCDVSRRDRTVTVLSLKAGHLTLVPRLAQPDVMTAREEDRINAFHAGGTTYDG